MTDLRILQPKRWLVASADRALIQQVRDALSKVEPEVAPLAAWRLKFGLLKLIETNALEREMRECLRDPGTGLRVHADIEPVLFDRLIESAVESGEDFRVGFNRLSAASVIDLLDELAKPDAWVMLAWVMSGRQRVPRLPCEPPCDDEHAQAFRAWADAYERALGPDGLAALHEAIVPDEVPPGDQEAATGADWRALELPVFEEGQWVRPEEAPQLLAAESDDATAWWVPRITWHGPTLGSSQKPSFQVRLLTRVSGGGHWTELKLELSQPAIRSSQGLKEVWLCPFLRPVIKVLMPEFQQSPTGACTCEAEILSASKADIDALIDALMRRPVTIHHRASPGQ